MNTIFLSMRRTIIDSSGLLYRIVATTVLVRWSTQVLKTTPGGLQELMFFPLHNDNLLRSSRMPFWHKEFNDILYLYRHYPFICYIVV